MSFTLLILVRLLTVQFSTVTFPFIRPANAPVANTVGSPLPSGFSNVFKAFVTSSTPGTIAPTIAPAALIISNIASTSVSINPAGLSSILSD